MTLDLKNDFISKVSWGAAIIMIAASAFWRPPTPIEQKMLVAPPPYIEYFTFGYNQVVADGLWIRAIQDFDFCDQEIAKQVCKGQGWLYHMLDTITTLAPDNRIVFLTGPVELSVIVNDMEGASKLFDKAVLHFPDDWTILYRASYHANFEEHNKKKAADLLVRAAKIGGPIWFNNLATSLYTDAGQKELGISLYKNLKASGADEKVLARMRQKLGITDAEADSANGSSVGDPSVQSPTSAH